MQKRTWDKCKSFIEIWTTADLPVMKFFQSNLGSWSTYNDLDYIHADTFNTLFWVSVKADYSVGPVNFRTLCSIVNQSNFDSLLRKGCNSFFILYDLQPFRTKPSIWGLILDSTVFRELYTVFNFKHQHYFSQMRPEI
jgi:hypothetical protein